MLDEAGKEDASVPWLTQEIVNRSTRQLDMEIFQGEDHDTILEVLRLLSSAATAYLNGQIESNPHPMPMTSAQETAVKKAQEALVAPLWFSWFYLGTQYNYLGSVLSFLLK